MEMHTECVLGAILAVLFAYASGYRRGQSWLHKARQRRDA